MTGVPAGHWAGRFLAVCDPEPPATRHGEPMSRRRLPGTRLIPPEEATRNAIAGLQEAGLYERESWSRVLRDSNPGRPLLVQRLDRTDTFYYIVPMQTGAEQISVMASVDARYGDYRQAVAIPARSRSLSFQVSGDTAQEQVVGRRVELGERLGRVLVRPEAICRYPMLVWKPCRESLSPFYPFTMFTVGAHHLYVRVDGAVFTELHDQDRGL
jgi:hypothetical protein